MRELSVPLVRVRLWLAISLVVFFVAGFWPVMRADGRSFHFWECCQMVYQRKAFVGTTGDMLLVLIPIGILRCWLAVIAGGVLHHIWLVACAMKNADFRRYHAWWVFLCWGAFALLVTPLVIGFAQRAEPRTPEPTFQQEFDIGEGRTLKVWGEGHPPYLYYRVHADEEVLVRATELHTRLEGPIEFRMVTAEAGRLVCVYEKNHTAKDGSLLLVYDAETRTSWPADWNGAYMDVAARWRDQVQKLKTANPELPIPVGFE